MKKYIILITILLCVISTQAAFAQIQKQEVDFSYAIDECVEYDSDGYVSALINPYKYRFFGSNLLEAEIFVFEAFTKYYADATFVPDLLHKNSNGVWRPMLYSYINLDISTMEVSETATETTATYIIGIDIDTESVSYEEVEAYNNLILNSNGHESFFHTQAKNIPVRGVYYIYSFPDDYRYVDVRQFAAILDDSLKLQEESCTLPSTIASDIGNFTPSGQHLMSGNYTHYDGNGWEINIISDNNEYVDGDYIFLSITKDEAINARNAADVIDYAYNTAIRYFSE